MLTSTVNSNIWLESAQIIQFEALAEETCAENPGRVKFPRKFLLVISPGVEAQVGIQRTEIRVSADVVPVRVGDEDGCQLRQARRMRAQRFVCRPREVGCGAGVNANQFPPVF